MRVIILAATSYKAKVADQLIEDPDISKVLVSVGSKKLATQAQALIIYYESEDDLKTLDPLLKIYLGVPLKFYFGDANYDKKAKFY